MSVDPSFPQGFSFWSDGLQVLLLILGYATCVFFLAASRQRNDLADVAWGPGFFLGAFFLYQYHSLQTWRNFLILFLLALWALRLALHIFMRGRGQPEDERYQQMRKEWGNSVLLQSYLKVFLLQGLILWVVGLPIWLGVVQPDEVPCSLDLVGLVLWCLGMIFEGVADVQLVRFKKRKRLGRVARDAILDQGLWKYSRHPNYFGEALLWWGFGVMALAGQAPIWVLLGPALITFLLIKVSGIPLLEAKYAQNSAFFDYQKRTSAFILCFPRRSHSRSQPNA